MNTSELVATSSEQLSASAERNECIRKITYTIQEVAQSSEEQSAQMTASEHKMIQVSNELANITENAGQMASRSHPHKKWPKKVYTISVKFIHK